jgi:hypothetical protein
MILRVGVFICVGSIVVADIFKRNRASFHWLLPSRNLKVRIGAQKQEIGAS